MLAAELSTDSEHQRKSQQCTTGFNIQKYSLWLHAKTFHLVLINDK